MEEQIKHKTIGKSSITVCVSLVVSVVWLHYIAKLVGYMYCNSTYILDILVMNYTCCQWLKCVGRVCWMCMQLLDSEVQSVCLWHLKHNVCL